MYKITWEEYEINQTGLVFMDNWYDAFMLAQELDLSDARDIAIVRV